MKVKECFFIITHPGLALETAGLQIQAASDRVSSLPAGACIEEYTDVPLVEAMKKLALAKRLEIARMKAPEEIVPGDWSAADQLRLRQGQKPQGFHN